MRLNVLLAVGAAALLAAFVAAYFFFGGSDIEPENGLTLEQQSPRVQSTQTRSDRQDETPDEVQTPEQTAGEEPQETQTAQPDSNGEAPQRPENAQTQAEDPFTVEFRDAVNEFMEVGDQMVERFPDFPIARAMAGIFKELGEGLLAHEAELAQQGLSREERIAKLKAKANSIGEQTAGNMDSVFGDLDPGALADDPEAAARFAQVGEEFAKFFEEKAGATAKLTNLLGLEQ